MKKLLSLILTLVLIVGIIPIGMINAMAYTYKDGYLTYEIYLGEAVISSCNQSITGEVIIPSTINGAVVTDINSFAFLNCDNLTKITIPEGVTYIGVSAFSSCDNLGEIELPDSVNSIGVNAFSATAYYSNEDNWTDGLLYIGNHLIAAERDLSGTCNIREGTLTIGTMAFYDCLYLDAFTIPDSVTSINQQAFDRTGYYLDSNNWENDVLYIGKHLIESRDYISGHYTVKDGTITISCFAFDGRKKLTGVTFPNTLKNIGIYSFTDCEKLNSDIVIPDSVESIGDFAFCYTTSKNVILGKNLKTIGDAGLYIVELESITIPDSVTYVGEDAFNDNTVIRCNKNSNAEKQLLAKGYEPQCGIWQQNNNGWWYSYFNGGWPVNEWELIGGKWYFFNNSGYMLANTWKQDSTGWCYLGADGYMLTNSWVKDSVGWCYVGVNGYFVTNTWKKDSIGWCYLDSNGRMVVNGYVKDSKGLCYLDKNGYWDGIYR